MITPAKIKSSIITETVLDLFRRYPLPVFDGLITTGDVCRAVEEAMYANGFVYTCREDGEAHDAIRLYGPECENDVGWLASYSKRNDGNGKR